MSQIIARITSDEGVVAALIVILPHHHVLLLNVYYLVYIFQKNSYLIMLTVQSQISLSISIK
jgi:hypothetical protein